MGATGETAVCITARTMAATSMETQRLFMTRKTEKVNFSASSPSP